MSRINDKAATSFRPRLTAVSTYSAVHSMLIIEATLATSR